MHNLLERVAQELWSRFAPEHHIEWEDEQGKAEYRLAAEAVLDLASHTPAPQPGGAVKAGPISVTPELVRYIAQYGGRCRDCADTIMRPVCEGTGMPCGGADGAVRHVLSAINYGFAHGFLNPPPPPSTEPATHSLEDGK